MKRIELAKIADIVMGQSPKGDTCNEIGIGHPLLNGPTEFTGFCPVPKQYTKAAKRFCRENDILFCVRGSTTGRMNWADKQYAIGRGIAAIRHKDNADLNFYLKYLIHINLPSILKSTSGSTFPNLPADMLASTVLHVLRTECQLDVSTLLKNLDSKIELNNRINAQLDQMAETLYDYWFVQFDFPDKKGRPYKSSGGKMAYNKQLKRKVPEGWEVTELGQVLKTCLGGTPSTKIKHYWTGGTYPWLSSGEIANFPIVNAESFITQAAIDNSATSLMPRGTVVLSITRYIRPSILAIDACANQSVVGIYESEDFQSSFIYPYMVNEVPRYMSIRTGAQQPHINKDTVDFSLLAVPPKDVLDRYYKFCNPLYAEVVNNALQNRKLAELRDWLLPMLMNDQVKVKRLTK